MKSKLLPLLDSLGYHWTYCSLGGSIRVKIACGDDIAHLDKLDQKLWTVLSCPVGGLHFDDKTLKYLDSDNDGRIRVGEVVEAAKWLCSIVRNADTLLEGGSSMPLDNFNPDSADGAGLLESAKWVISHSARSQQAVSLDDMDSMYGLYSALKFRQVWSSHPEDEVFPFGSDTGAALSAVDALDSKISDYFLRCRLVAFDADASAAVDVSVGNIAAAAADQLSTATPALSQAPLARPCKDALLPLDGINPAWQAVFTQLKTLVLDRMYPGAAHIDEAQWKEVVGRFGIYRAYLSDRKKIDGMGAISDESLDGILAAEGSDSIRALLNDEQALDKQIASIKTLDKFMHLYRYFYDFLRNYVLFSDFYSIDPQRKAMFEAGKLYIDQRCCSLCVKVENMSAHADMASLSGMFLIYCTCTSTTSGEKMDIVAVMTDGPIYNLRPGTNGVFFDRDGASWEAVVSKIVDNPVSVAQAFWSPYRKCAAFITDKIGKGVKNKEDEADAQLKKAAESFDIAKFAGIFAALGMAIGYIGAFFTKLIGGVTSVPFWETLLVIIGIMLCISGPSCLIAWLKLRKRNLGPVLNANGWAINADVRVNNLFGQTLTSVAKYPKMNLEDPFSKKKTPIWGKLLAAVVIALLAAGAVYLCIRQNEKAVSDSAEPTETVEQTSEEAQ